MDNKPVFGASMTSPNPVAPTTPKKPEVGAIWVKVGKKSHNEYLTLKFDKKLLKTLLDNSEEEDFRLIAFFNRDKNGQENRPSFRIFEETPIKKS